MTDQTPLEQKREEAKRYAGVSYDNRIDRFTAAITIDGQKKYLGSFVSAALASAAYKKARAQHPIQRPRANSDSIRERMLEFNSSADYYENKVIAGQFFTAPDGQRFRLEGTERYKRRDWYVWSSACRACGAFFTQYTGMDLDNVVSMTRNCKQHHGERDGQAWPDPKEWGAPASVSFVEAPRKADASTQRAHEDHLESIWKKIQGDKDLEQRFNHIENVVMRAFFEKFDNENPDANKYARYAAWLDQPEDPFAALITQPTNARLEDVEALAEPVVDNSDLA